MTNQQKALHMAAVFLRLQSMGCRYSKAECKTMSDVCFVTLPMKYRLSRVDLANLEAVVNEQRAKRKKG